MISNSKANHVRAIYVIFTMISCFKSETHSNAIQIYMNKVWPIANPIETYRSYDFPFCQPPTVHSVEMSLGQVLRGDRLTNSVYAIDFEESGTKEFVCEKSFSAGELTRLSDAIKQKYMYEMVVGGFPVSLAFGTPPMSLCTHVKF